MKVCILARESIMHWEPFYVAAFREQCDTLVVGPAMNRERLTELGWTNCDGDLEPNDIISEEYDALALLALLPEGWRPDLVVAIQSAAPEYRNIARIGCPTVYLSIDTWHDPQEFAYARAFDFVFTAQRSFPEYFRRAGLRNAYWLPLAAAPRCHLPVSVEKRFDFAFVGMIKYVVNQERVQRIQRLIQHFTVGADYGLRACEMGSIFAMGRIAFNSSIAQDVNMRVFETLAMGCPLLTNRDAEANGLFDLFAEGRHLFTYDDADLIARAQYLLGRPEECAQAARAGREEVLARHTYAHRVCALLDTVAAAAPGLGRSTPPSPRDDDAAVTWLPYGARVALDVGLGIERSRVALRAMGITHFAGVARDAARLAQRRRSYDEVALWPYGFPEGGVDVVVWTAPFDFDIGLEEVLRRAHPALEPGGTLILRMRRDELDRLDLEQVETWDAALHERGFHLVVDRPAASGESWRTFVMRKFTDKVYDLSCEIYERFPGGDLRNRAAH
jgi:hypothetical protein